MLKGFRNYYTFFFEDSISRKSVEETKMLLHFGGFINVFIYLPLTFYVLHLSCWTLDSDSVLQSGEVLGPVSLVEVPSLAVL